MHGTMNVKIENQVPTTRFYVAQNRDGNDSGRNTFKYYELQITCQQNVQRSIVDCLKKYYICFIFRQVLRVAKKRLLASSRPSVRLYQSGSRRTDFCGEIWYGGLVIQSVEKHQIWLKSDKISATWHEYRSTFYCCRR